MVDKFEVIIDKIQPEHEEVQTSGLAEATHAIWEGQHVEHNELVIRAVQEKLFQHERGGVVEARQPNEVEPDLFAPGDTLNLDLNKSWQDQKEKKNTHTHKHPLIY